MDTLLTALAPAVWGTTYLVSTELLPPDRPFTTAALRTLPAGVLLALLAGYVPARRDWGRLAALSALNIGIFQALLFIAASRLPGGVAAVVSAVQPLLVVSLAWGIDRRTPLSKTLWAGGLGVAGMAALLLSPESAWDAVGVLAALFGAASMGLGTFLSRRWQSGMPVLAFTGWQLALGGLMVVPISWAVEAPLPALSTSALLGFAYLSVVGTLLAYALWFRGIARLSPVAVSSLGLLSPVTAVVLGWAVLGQRIQGLSLVGLATVLASVVAVQWSVAPRPANAAVPQSL